jgi:hypothetical protein
MTRLHDTLLSPQSADRRAMSEFEPVGYSNFGNTTSNPAPRRSETILVSSRNRTRGVCACIRRVADCATPTGSTGHGGRGCEGWPAARQKLLGRTLGACFAQALFEETRCRRGGANDSRTIVNIPVLARVSRPSFRTGSRACVLASHP